ncbi:MAG TPA: hypothetical protein VGD81_00205 [Opitutaceae bacterium]
MAVIPLTLTISLCLVFTFVVFFWREHSRRRFSSAESEALLPLAEETPRVVTAQPMTLELRGRRSHRHAGGCSGASDGSATRCSDCPNQPNS